MRIQGLCKGGPERNFADIAQLSCGDEKKLGLKIKGIKRGASLRHPQIVIALRNSTCLGNSYVHPSCISRHSSPCLCCGGGGMLELFSLPLGGRGGGSEAVIIVVSMHLPLNQLEQPFSLLFHIPVF